MHQLILQSAQCQTTSQMVSLFPMMILSPTALLRNPPPPPTQRPLSPPASVSPQPTPPCRLNGSPATNPLSAITHPKSPPSNPPSAPSPTSSPAPASPTARPSRLNPCTPSSPSSRHTTPISSLHRPFRRKDGTRGSGKRGVSSMRVARRC